MKIMDNHIKRLKKGNFNFFCGLNVCLVFMLSFLSVIGSIEAQEYAAARLFVKQYKKTKCRNEAEKKIRKMKKRPEMNLEQEVILIQNIWVKLRSNPPLSRG